MWDSTNCVNILSTKMFDVSWRRNEVEVPSAQISSGFILVINPLETRDGRSRPHSIQSFVQNPFSIINNENTFHIILLLLNMKRNLKEVFPYHHMHSDVHISFHQLLSVSSVLYMFSGFKSSIVSKRLRDSKYLTLTRNHFS